MVRRRPDSHQFEVLPRRWVVERMLAWLSRCRRLSKDYEELPETGETWVHIAMVHLMLKRLNANLITLCHTPSYIVLDRGVSAVETVLAPRPARRCALPCGAAS